MNKDPISIELNLWHAIKKDLIIETHHKGLNEFAFSHDKIQLACVNQNSFDKEKTNAIIGRKLKDELENKIDNVKKTSLIYHLNQGVNQLTEAEQKDLINLNFEHGISQLKKLYGKSAANHFSKAIELYKKTNSTNKDILFDIYIAKIKSLQLNSQFKNAITLLNEINVLFDDQHKKQRLVLMKMNIHITQSEYKKVLEIGISTLKQHNHSLKTDTKINICFYKIFKTLIKLILSFKTLNNKKVTTNTDILFLSKIFFELIGPAYFVDKKIYISIICDFLNFSLNHGITKETPFTILLFTKIILAGFSPFKLVKYFSDVSFKLLNQFDNYVIKVNSIIGL